MASDEAKVIQGTHEVVFTLKFNVPPGVPPEVFVAKLAENVSVSIGLVGFLRETHSTVNDRKSPAVQLL